MYGNLGMTEVSYRQADFSSRGDSLPSRFLEIKKFIFWGRGSQDIFLLLLFNKTAKVKNKTVILYDKMWREVAMYLYNALMV